MNEDIEESIERTLAAARRVSTGEMKLKILRLLEQELGDTKQGRRIATRISKL